MSQDCKAVGNYILDRCLDEGYDLTPMALHRLVYFAHGWHWASAGRPLPLLAEAVHAWEHGPVVPALYFELKGYGADPVTRLIARYDPKRGRDEPYSLEYGEGEEAAQRAAVLLLESVWDVAKVTPAAELRELVQGAGTPWREARDGRSAGPGFGPIIPDEATKDYFRRQAPAAAAVGA